MPRATPNYLLAETDGKVSAVFPGGVTIDANDSFNYTQGPPPAHAVRWKRTSDGAVVAYIAEAYDDFFNQAVMAIRANADSDPGIDTMIDVGVGANVDAADDATLRVRRDGSSASIQAFAGGAGPYVLIDALRRSEFLHNAGATSNPLKAYVYFGQVSSGGAYVQGNFALPWFRFGLGQYATSFATSGSMYLALANPFGAMQQSGRFSAVTTTSVNVAMYSGGALGDSDFYYLMIRDAPT